MFSVFALLSACGGGGGNSDGGAIGAPNQSPAVDAGTDQTVYEGTTVQLAGTASDPDGTIVAISWRQIAGPAISLDDSTSLTAQFVAPSVSSDTSVVLEVSATDNAGAGSTDQVTITVQTMGASPIADAGLDQAVIVNTVVTLDGTASSDADGDPLSYEWRILSAPASSSATLSASDVVTPDLVPDVPGTYEVELIVRDAINSSAPDTTVITAGTEIAGGVYGSGLTLTALDSPYLMTGDVQIPYGATMTIPAEVSILGDGNVIRVGGTLVAEGAFGQLIRFTDVHIEPATGPNNELFSIDLVYVHLVGGSVYRPTGFAIYGGLRLTDSRIEDTEPNSYIYVWYPETESRIERNVFIRTGGISAGHRDADVIVRNNAFIEQTTDFAIENWASYGTSRTIVDRNSFLSTDRTALLLRPGYPDGFLEAPNNYWGTADTATIDEMIFDASDDINSAAIINYLPIITEPDALTPAP